MIADDAYRISGSFTTYIQDDELLKTMIERQDFLCQNVPYCIRCGADQVQIIDWTQPAIWKCRICKQRFTSEPEPIMTGDHVIQYGQTLKRRMDWFWWVLGFAPLPHGAFYHFRYARHLWRHVPGMTLWQAWIYPRDNRICAGDPIEDADEEMSLMGE